MLESMRRRRATERLADHLEPGEEVIVGSVGIHPRAMYSLSFVAVFLLGCLAGIVLGNLFGGLVTFFVILVSTLTAWWYYLSRNPSGRQPAGLEPWVALTDRRIIYVRGGVGDRITGVFEVPISDIAAFAVGRFSVFMPPTHLTTTDGSTVSYRIMHARRIKKELDKAGVT